MNAPVVKKTFSHQASAVLALTCLCLLALAMCGACGGGTSSSQPPPPPPPFGHNYTTNFPLAESPISESGKWISGQAGLDWADVRTLSGKAIGTETGNGGFDDSTALLTGSWGADQTLQATVYSANPTFNGEVELRLHSALSSHTCTGYEVNFSSGYSQIVRWEGPLGQFTILASNTSVSVTKNDVVKATISGNVITAYINNVQVNQVTDSTYTSGTPGIGFYHTSGGSANDQYGFSSFTAKD
jgi:hypothetical protein